LNGKCSIRLTHLRSGEHETKDSYKGRHGTEKVKNPCSILYIKTFDDNWKGVPVLTNLTYGMLYAFAITTPTPQQ